MVSLAVDHVSSTINYGFAVEYSNFYLRANVHDFGLPEWVNRLTPLVFFCSTAALPAAFTGPTPPACTDHDGTFKGTFTAANVQAIPTQNVVVMDFDALADAIESNTAYANIHTTALPAGEIRGQIRRGDRDEHHDNHDNHEHK